MALRKAWRVTQHWRGVARRQLLCRTLKCLVSNDLSRVVWQEWSKVATTAQARGAELLQLAEVFRVQKKTHQARGCFLAWRRYTALRLRLQLSGSACWQIWRKRLLEHMQRAAHNSRIIRMQVGRRNTAILRRLFGSWVISRRCRRRDQAVTQLLVDERSRTLQYDILRTWVAATANELAAAAQRRRSLLRSYWVKWKAFTCIQSRLRCKTEELNSRGSFYAVQTSFRLWRTNWQQRRRWKVEAFAAWRILIARRKTLNNAENAVKVKREKGLMLEAMSFWTNEFLLSTRHRAVSTASLYKKGLKAFKSFRALRLHLRTSEKLVSALQHRHLERGVIKVWNNLRRRKDELQKLQMELQVRQLLRSLQWRWNLWRRRTATAIALRHWVTQALDCPTGEEIPQVTQKTLESFAIAESRKAEATKNRLKETALVAHEWKHIQPRSNEEEVPCQQQVRMPQEVQFVLHGNRSTKSVTDEFGGHVIVNLRPQKASAEAFPVKRDTPKHRPSHYKLAEGTDSFELGGSFPIAHRRMKNSRKRLVGQLHVSTSQVASRDVSIYSEKNPRQRDQPPSGGTVEEIWTCAACRESSSIAGRRSAESVFHRDGLISVSEGGGNRGTESLIFEVDSFGYRAIASPCRMLAKPQLAHNQQSRVVSRYQDFQMLRRRQLSLWGDHLLVLYWRRKILQVTALWRLLTAQRRGKFLEASKCYRSLLLQPHIDASIQQIENL